MSIESKIADIKQKIKLVESKEDIDKLIKELDSLKIEIDTTFASAKKKLVLTHQKKNLNKISRGILVLD